MKYASQKQSETGSIIVSLLIIIIILAGFVYGLLSFANASIVRSRQRVSALQSQYAAESGADMAISKLNDDSTYAGTGGEVTLLDSERYKATFEATVLPGDDDKQRYIEATGYIYMPADASTASFTHEIEVTAEQSAATTSNAMLSRNIISLSGGVKSVTATDVFVNGYVELDKNDTNLIAETITVADRDTGPDNCSIGGRGNLSKPDSFSDPDQTKTKIHTAYNNCISPPGNSNTTDFDVMANQNDIEKVQSTFIPWSYIIDDTYGASPTGCAEWTTGDAIRDIPESGNEKLTHYPDTDSGISSGCGNDGDLDLGNNQYNIHDHVHVRANFCEATGCTPTFHNPDTGTSGLKFIFVEGWINFERMTTTPDSGPIVFVSLGSDPEEKLDRCPLGASIFLGNNGDTVAPAAFLLANNGVCLDRTRFGDEPALGGLSGKNIYVGTNPGTPFDLKLDPAFPTEEIPIDLAWRAIRYREL